MAGPYDLSLLIVKEAGISAPFLRQNLLNISYFLDGFKENQQQSVVASRNPRKAAKKSTSYHSGTWSAINSYTGI